MINQLKRASLKAASIAAVILMCSPTFANAGGVNINQYTEDVAKNSGYNTSGVTDTTLSQTIGRVIRLLLSFTGTIFLCLTVYAGFLWMTAGGNSEQVEKAQNIMRTALIGLIIIIGCYGLTVFGLAAITAVTNTQNSSVGKIF